MSKKGKIIVIVAPSGTGKSTLINKVMQELSYLSWSVSSTTRPIREGEVDGVNYDFITEEEFLSLRKENQFIEWAQVHSNYYGTKKSFIDEGLSEGKNLLFDLDVQGCDAIKEVYGAEARVIFIEPPSVEELERRLLARATDAENVIQERLNNAKKELLRKDDYDYKVVNDDFETAYLNLKNVIESIVKG